MRNLAIILAVFAVGCRSERLHRTFDSRCFQPCYNGNQVHAGKGVCSMGTWTCVEPEDEPVCEGWGEPTVEACNGLDDDCNGVVDEVVDVCRNVCGLGTRVCRDGAWGQCVGVNPKPEVCNGLDDDCDGKVDEPEDVPLEVCYSGKSSELMGPATACHPGIYRCESGQKVCRNEELPSAEICDKKDNDCDNSVDEDIVGCVNGKISQGIDIQASWDRVNDIDLHLLHPNAGSSHNLANWAGGVLGLDCYFGNKTPNWDNLDSSEDNPVLNRDYIREIGGETITLPRPVIGHKYTIGVYTFNHSAAPYAVNTTVKVFCSGNLVTVQAHSFNRQGEMWVVGTVEYITSSNCIFTSDGFVMP